MAKQEKLVFGLLGCGRIGTRHAGHIVDHGVLGAVCDIDKEKADDLAAKYKVKAYYSLSDMLAGEKDIDVISICTPNGLHAAHSIASLNAGKHVLC
ncbi:MAG TPA: Gfo/Idh/MocA family oxidoreductase, partial [Phnomibacter sp.]|nr:Gfo/Idh/MocA family oxidoreductase [Phnomibacter sp.]